MKIDINQIPLEGITLEEEINPAELDLVIEGVVVPQSLKVKADFTKVTGNVIAKTSVSGSIKLSCSRCLKEIESRLSKDFILSYQTVNGQSIIDLDDDIREEVMVEYPLKSLCNPDCKGLCPSCGRDLNEGKCSCSVK